MTFKNVNEALYVRGGRTLRLRDTSDRVPRIRTAKTAVSVAQYYVLLLLFMVAPAIPAGAHAILLKSSLPANSVVSGTAIAVSLTFNSRIDGERSRCTLIGPDSSEHNIDLGTQKSPNILTAALHDLKPGSYRLRWQVLAVDGHITRGEIPFRVQLHTT